MRRVLSQIEQLDKKSIKLFNSLDADGKCRRAGYCEKMGVLGVCDWRGRIELSAASKKQMGKPAAGKPAAATSKERGGAKKRILAAAEQVFAESGYDGATVRQIALAADAPIALVNYHFGSKEGLYRAIFELRTPTIVGQRVSGMEIADMETEPDRQLDLLVKSLIAPMFKLRAAERQSWFGRILSREVSDPKSNERRIIQDLLDPIAEQFMSAMARCRPDLSEAEINWAYQLMIGGMVYIMADNGRISRLSEGKCDPDDYRAATQNVVAFLVAGFKGM